MASASESTAAKLAELKKEIVEILSACEACSLDISKFKHEYKVRFDGRNFDKHYKQLTKGKKFKNFMAELDDIIVVQESENGHGFVMKLKESASSHSTKKDLPSPEKMASTAKVSPQQAKADSKLPPKSPVSPKTPEKKSSVASVASKSSITSKDDSSNVSSRKFLKAHRRVVKSTEIKEGNDEPPEENVAPLIGPELPASSSSDMLMGARSLLPLSPPPVPRLEASSM